MVKMPNELNLAEYNLTGVATRTFTDGEGHLRTVVDLRCHVNTWDEALEYAANNGYKYVFWVNWMKLGVYFVKGC